MTFCKDEKAGEVKSFAQYSSIEVPTRADASCLIVCLQQTLQTVATMCLTRYGPTLIGVGIGGTFVLQNNNVMKGNIA